MKSNRRTYLLLAVLVLLGLGTWWLTQRAKRTGSTLDQAATAFAVPDTAAVDKIFIANKRGDQFTFRRVARNYWRLNERYDVRGDMMKMLLGTINRVRVKSPVAKAGRNSAIRMLATNGIKVEVYQRGELVNTFYVGPPTQDMEGTYMIREGYEQPFITHIPGFVGFLTSRFTININDWRSAPVFTTPSKLLERVEVVAAGKPEKTFTLRRDGNRFLVDGIPPEQTDTTITRIYSGLFARAVGQNFLDSAQRREADSLLRRPPDYVVTVRQQRVARPDRIRLWKVKGDEDHLLGITNRDSMQALVVQTYLFNNLLIGRDNFRKGSRWRPEF